MVNKVSWYFKISEKAGFAEDENGEPSSCYCEYKLNFEQEIDETSFTKEYKEQATIVKEQLAEQFKISKDWINVISKEEYLANTDDN